MTRSIRSEVTELRTYRRPLDNGGFETQDQMIDRALDHQRWLWETAQGAVDEQEISELRGLLIDRKSALAGRTYWLGGTDISRRWAASQFNCAFAMARSPKDLEDIFWLLLLGCGVGFKPMPGGLTGFARTHKVKIIESEQINKSGEDETTTSLEGSTWVIKVGDSAIGWAESVKLLASGKHRHVETIVIDLSAIRPPGSRLKGFGWISAGWRPLAKAYEKICEILNKRAGRHLTAVDIVDIVNHLGTVLSTRRSAQIAVYDHGDSEWFDFGTMKRALIDPEFSHRQQSNNSLIMWDHPTKKQIAEFFDLLQEGGGSEPGLINGHGARKRAPWFKGLNPCAEILLYYYSFCNLVEIDLGKFKSDSSGLERATYLMARANYRQACVDLKDGILSPDWHNNNDFLRLCGVSLTGIVRRPDLTAYDLRQIRNSAILGAYSMADELDLPRPKAVTTIKPSGTMSKIMDTTEGIHRPIGKYVLNSILFAKEDPIIGRLAAAGYTIIPHPNRDDTVVAQFPVSYNDVDFKSFGDPLVNKEPAIQQLNRYKFFMDNYVDHNASITVSYDKAEIPDIVDWVHNNWDDSFVAVSWMPRLDPWMSPEDVGFPYLPQQVLTQEAYNKHVRNLKQPDLSDLSSKEVLEIEDEQACKTGACPIR